MSHRGVRFARVLAQSSWTRPSIASLLTSRYPREIGIYKEKAHVLDDRFQTLAELLRESGYTTVGATANPNINGSFNFDQGFDHYEDSDTLFHWMQEEPGKASDHRASDPDRARAARERSRLDREQRAAALLSCR